MAIARMCLLFAANSALLWRLTGVLHRGASAVANERVKALQGSAPVTILCSESIHDREKAVTHWVGGGPSHKCAYFVAFFNLTMKRPPFRKDTPMRPSDEPFTQSRFIISIHIHAHHVAFRSGHDRKEKKPPKWRPLSGYLKVQQFRRKINLQGDGCAANCQNC